jgi:hypothetical protein
MMSITYVFLSGAIAMGYAIASLFFLRFWRRTRDRLFLAFAVAFLLLVLNSTLVSLSNVPIENRAVLYLLRLAAFSIIIGAVIQKSRSSR